MKCRIVILPFIIFGLFFYGIAKLNEATANDTKPVTVQALKKVILEDAHDVERVIHKETK